VSSEKLALMQRSSPRFKLLPIILMLVSTINVFFFLFYKFYSFYWQSSRPQFRHPSPTPVDSLAKFAKPAQPVPSATPESVRDPPQTPIDTIHTNTSIAFYTICGASQNIKGADLRGNFWEWQLKYFTGQSATYYFSDGPLHVNGIDFLVLPADQPSFQDSRFCIRTPETWKHFLDHQPDTKWYFRGTHDTFVNLTSLTLLIHELEQEADPMTSMNFAFNFHEYNYEYYPHGGTGWLFSNYAVRKMSERMGAFISRCESSADDVAMTWFLRQLGVDVMDYQTNKFIVTWPNHLLDVIFEKQYHDVRMCPPSYALYPGARGLKPGPCRTAASIHMHRVPMDQVWSVLSQTPEDFAVFFPDPNTPTFCRL
jgi:hypothetical protein